MAGLCEGGNEPPGSLKAVFLDAPRSGRPTILTEKLDEISAITLWSPTKSTRKLAQGAGISKWTAHKAVRSELQLYSYKITVVHELKESDYEKITHWGPEKSSVYDLFIVEIQPEREMVYKYCLEPLLLQAQGFISFPEEIMMRILPRQKIQRLRRGLNLRITWLFNDAASTTRLFSVYEIGDSQMVFGEMRPRIRHRLSGIHLTVGENLGKKPNQVISPCGDRAHARAQLQTGRQAS
ncbi:hypothetical protein ANN_11268 [Periplaneta americana]|uniref:Uncharacterized protein n=1 Tax=Periplaneta americana TaxID=6978 RepID=A0ABQ8T596_PERAM|nr:hypothetical protein ANN_11268 [Periplaneta americana]